jgi:hypothetical protein
MEVLIGKVLCSVLATLASLLMYFGQRHAFGVHFDKKVRFSIALFVCSVRIFLGTLPYFFLVLFGHYALHGVTKLNAVSSISAFLTEVSLMGVAALLGSLLWFLCCLFWAGLLMVYPLPLLLHGQRAYFVGLCLFTGVITWCLGFYIYRPIGSPF